VKWEEGGRLLNPFRSKKIYQGGESRAMTIFRGDDWRLSIMGDRKSTRESEAGVTREGGSPLKCVAGREAKLLSIPKGTEPEERGSE